MIVLFVFQSNPTKNIRAFPISKFTVIFVWLLGANSVRVLTIGFSLDSVINDLKVPVDAFTTTTIIKHHKPATRRSENFALSDM